MPNITELPLHEVVLKIMYLEDTEKAAKMSPEDILWRIDNPDISERQISEVLEWLLREKRVVKYLGKYSLDRIEFLEQREVYNAHLYTNEKKVKARPPKTFYINEPKSKKSVNKLNSYLLGIFALFMVLFAYMTYRHIPSDLNFDESILSISLTVKNSDTISKQKQLYTSGSDEYDQNVRNAIYNSFVRQNEINQTTIGELNTLKRVIDSMQYKHIKDITSLKQQQQEEQKNFNYFVKQLIIGNILLIAIFSVSLALIYSKSKSI